MNSCNLVTVMRSFRRTQLLLLPFSSSVVQQSHLVSTQPVPAARLPCRVKLSAGKRYAWCACGHSKKQPFCDGAHKSKAPNIPPLRFTADKDRTVFLCACKQTKNAPYCDNSHLMVIYRDVVKKVKSFFK
ncbi:CDGSH iron-sulfur domain-containing protein 3, mitochondrial [Cynoglossus semilaevis]|uniref:CDGSH iron-sulfur domain-containing protein 3, mitochondrial n=1 Tax=Cynoglossus semilaevis TaxID=244447 RepID=UPI0004967360|nr:CDGSH iron-sulfur domain-containing protein 3, mitochondrial [Cynoglossus semilaevis]